MLTEQEVRNLIEGYEKEVEDLKEYINFNLNNWTTNSKEQINSFTEQIEILVIKINTLKNVLLEN